MSDLSLPGWLLKVVIGFLRERKLILNYKGKESDMKNMPGGGPQGTILGMFLFIILINSAGFQGQNRSIGKHLTQPLKARKAMEPIHLKFIDDLTLAEAVNMKKSLLYAPNLLEKPLPFHSRSEHILPPNKSSVQQQLNELKRYSEKNELQINNKKSKVMVFNPPRRKIDFLPDLKLGDHQLEVVDEMKLLGVIVRSDLKWKSNTDNITKRAYARLWILRRLRELGASSSELIDIYKSQIRSILDFAVPVWAG